MKPVKSLYRTGKFRKRFPRFNLLEYIVMGWIVKMLNYYIISVYTRVPCMVDFARNVFIRTDRWQNMQCPQRRLSRIRNIKTNSSGMFIVYCILWKYEIMHCRMTLLFETRRSILMQLNFKSSLLQNTFYQKKRNSFTIVYYNNCVLALFNSLTQNFFLKVSMHKNRNSATGNTP